MTAGDESGEALARIAGKVGEIDALVAGIAALIGITGLATGPHVHWEDHLAGRLVDPLAQ